MDSAANNGSHADLAVRPLLEAGTDLVLAGIPVLPCHWPVESGQAADGWRRLGCSCGRADCPTPARHLVGEMTTSEATTDVVLVAQWWTGGLYDANLVTVAGLVFGVVELRYSAPPADIRAWLAAFQVEPGPVLDAEIGRTQFLTAVGPADPCFAPIGSTGGVHRLGHGAIVPLPPSRLTNRHQVTWLQGPHNVTLPEPEQLFAALARLPEPHDLAAWSQGRAAVA